MKKFLLASAILAAQAVSSQIHFRLAPFADETWYNTSGRLEYMSFAPDKSPIASEAESFINSNVLNDGPARLILFNTLTDEAGATHIRYHITYNGAEIANRQIVAHIRNGKLIAINGELDAPAAPVNQLSISEASALQSALGKVNAVKYKWENKAEEAHMREALNDPSFSFAPRGAKALIESAGANHYAWKFRIYAEEPLYHADVFVDAQSGKVLDEQSIICTANANGTAVTKYSGTQPIVCDQNTSNYRLRESGRGLGVQIETYNLANSTTYSNTDFTNATANWTVVNNDQGARDAHWGTEMTYDYYLNTHNRNSTNNGGAPLLSYVHYGNQFFNAFWDGIRMTYGDGNGSSWKIFTALDVCGHEITHGVTQNTGQLTSANEPGALNEAWSDMMGASIENYARPSNWNWRIGEDITTGGLRSMSQPNTGQNPDTYGGTYWYTGTQDNGGVHTNCGVANFWYYLLVTGGSGVNDLNNSYSVTGLGFLKASRIAYRAMSAYFTPNTNYAAARNYAIQAAKDLYGACSNEMIQTTNAWYAVGVGLAYSPAASSVNFYATQTNFCSVPAAVTFTNMTSNAGSYFWDFGDGTTSTNMNVVKTYTAPGNYTVKLKATGCNSIPDSTSRLSLITINPMPNPTVTHTTACSGAQATISASGSGQLNWYNNFVNPVPTGTGAVFVTPPVSALTTYYVANTSTSAPISGGITTIAGGGYVNNLSHYLTFDVMQNCVLKNVDVDADPNSPGLRIIEIRNSANTLLASYPVTLNGGQTTVPINYTFTPGINYKIGLGAGGTSFLYRTNSGVSYPYYLGNTIKITGSSQANSYFFFYNWDVTKSQCTSQRIPLNISVIQSPAVSMTAPVTTICFNDDPAILTGNPSGGTFSGTGISGNTFVPSLASGNYVLSYSYTDPNGCTGIDSSFVMRVDECTGLKSQAQASTVKLYPNPSSDAVFVSFSGGDYDLSVVDATGRIVFARQNADIIPAAQLAKGLYIVRIVSNGKTESLRLVRD